MAEEEVLNNSHILFLTLKAIGVISCVALSLSGIAIGMVKATPGMVLASEIKFEISTFLASLVFITAPSLYTFMIFMTSGRVPLKDLTIERAFGILMCGVILGISSGVAAYSLGVANRSLLVAKAKQSKFNVQFYLVNIFVEIVCLIGLILSFLCGSSGK